MAEEFINDYAAMVEQMGRRFDATDRALSLHSQLLAEISRKLDVQEVDLYDLKAILRQHSRDVSSIDKRLASVESGISETRDVLKQVLALLSKQGE